MSVTSGHPLKAITGVPLGQTNERTYSALKNGKYSVAWVESGKLKKGDYVGQVIPTQIIPVENFTEDDARMYGIILGDGHCSAKHVAGKESHCIEWGVTGEHLETTAMAFVKRYLEQRNINYYICPSTRNTSVQIKWSFSGKKLDRNELGHFVGGESCMPFGRDDIYREDGTKYINSKYMHLPLNQSSALVQGLIDTDGCISRQKEVTFCNTSVDLIEGIRYQMLRMGIPTAGNWSTNSNKHLGYDYYTTACEVRIPMVGQLAKLLGVATIEKYNWITVDGIVFSRVKSVTVCEQTDFVHDMKVDGDHSYLTTSALARNGGKRMGSFAPYI